MANAASLTISATILPDEVAKTISNISVSYVPASSAEGWYYRLTNVITSSQDLIEAKTYLQKGSTPTGVDTGSATSTVATTDEVKFLFVKHLAVTDDGSTSNTSDSIYLCLDADAAAHNLADAIEIGPNECWFGRFNKVTVADIHVISAVKAGAGGGSPAKIQCQVAAIIKDI